MAAKPPTLLDLARMVEALTRQLAAAVGRLEDAEAELGRLKALLGERRAKDGHLSAAERLARRRKVVADLNQKRWGKKKRKSRA